MRGSTGQLLGILSVDEPLSGRRPTGDEIDVLVAVSEHAALAIESAQEAAAAKANRDALGRLLEVSTSLNETWDAHELLAKACDAISDGLAFDRVRVQLLNEEGLHRTAAATGFADGENIGAAMSADELDAILEPEFEIEGCFLIPHDEARKRLPARPAG